MTKGLLGLSLYADVSDSDGCEHLRLPCTEALWSSGGAIMQWTLEGICFLSNIATILTSHQNLLIIEINVWLKMIIHLIDVRHSCWEGGDSDHNHTVN